MTHDAIQSLIDNPAYGIVGAIIGNDVITLFVDSIRPEQNAIPKTINGIPVTIGVSN